MAPSRKPHNRGLLNLHRLVCKKRKKTKISKRITERKTKTTQKIKDSSSQREQLL
jgi:hypothetical protein